MDLFFFRIISKQLCHHCYEDIAKTYYYPITNKELEDFKNTVDEKIKHVDGKLIENKYKELLDIDIKKEESFRLHLQVQVYIDYIESKMKVGYLKPFIIQVIKEIKQGINGLSELYDSFVKLKKEEKQEFVYNS